MAEFSLVEAGFAVLAVIVFAWLVKLSYDVKRAVENGFCDANYKATGLEKKAFEIKVELEALKASLGDKVSKKYLDERLEDFSASLKKRR